MSGDEVIEAAARVVASYSRDDPEVLMPEDEEEARDVLRAALEAAKDKAALAPDQYFAESVLNTLCEAAYPEESP